MLRVYSDGGVAQKVSRYSFIGSPRLLTKKITPNSLLVPRVPCAYNNPVVPANHNVSPGIHKPGLAKNNPAEVCY